MCLRVKESSGRPRLNLQGNKAGFQHLYSLIPSLFLKSCFPYFETKTLCFLLCLLANKLILLLQFLIIMSLITVPNRNVTGSTKT